MAATDAAAVAASLARHDARPRLRFITCGSVDDGKSTLIGRLLYESKSLFEDQLGALARDSHRYGTQGEAPDYALLLDGLDAEGSWSISRPWRSEVRVTSISAMIFSSVSASDSKPPVSG